MLDSSALHKILICGNKMRNSLQNKGEETLAFFRNSGRFSRDYLRTIWSPILYFVDIGVRVRNIPPPLRGKNFSYANESDSYSTYW